MLASRLAATPTQSDTEGWWRDDFTDSSGITVKQNARVGPSLSPGVCVALNKWNWTQSYTPASNTISTPFSDIRAQHNLTLVNSTCSTCLWEDVGLWRQEYSAGQDFTLGASVTMLPGGEIFQLYTRAADKIEAAVAVQLGRSIDVTG